MGTYLKNNGHDVKILEGDKYGLYGDLDFSAQEALYGSYLQNLNKYSDPFWKTLYKEIKKFQPDYIGITVWTTIVASAIHTARYCRKVCPSAIIIAGGPHVTLLPEDIKELKAFDIGVIGEGELTILEIVEGKPLNSIHGIFYSENGTIKQNQRREFVENLDNFGIPDRSLLINQENYEPEDMGLIMTSRGCPFKCAYCATKIWDNKVRNRSIDSVVDEIKSVKKKYGTIYFTIKDDSFTINKRLVNEFCHKLKKDKVDVLWECNANLHNLDREMLIEMRSAGCIGIKVGIESGSDRIHKTINKNLNNNIIRSRIKIFDGIKVHLTCYFMIGIPGETKDDILNTLNLAYEIKPDFISLSVYEIFPGTKLHRLGIEENTAIERMEIEDYFRIQPHNYFYSNYKRHLARMPNDEFDSLEKYIRRKIHNYNRSPRSIYLRAKSRLPLYKNDINYFFDDVRKFVKWF
jgi:radical SAM superfamily enzyme YgiQ (UPF0313 family)